MLKLKKYFPSAQAMHTFIILLIGIVLIYGASLFVFNSYTSLIRHRPAPKIIAAEVIRVINVIKEIPPEQQKRILRNIKRGVLRLHISNKGPDAKQALSGLDTNSIHQRVLSNPYNMHIKYPLSNDMWLTITTNLSRPTLLIIQFVLAILLLVVATVVLCAWVVKRLAIPFDNFITAAKRFGNDVNAPPLPETGNENARQAAQAFNEMQGRIRRLIQDRTQMLAAISHDLRTPITRLKLRAESLEPCETTEKIQADLKEMDYMITSILSFARDRMANEAEQNFDLAALVESICDDLQDLGFRVRVDSEIARFPYSGRMNALKRAFTNIIENALKYGDEAEVKLQVVNDQLHIKIKDRGPGIPESELENIFLPFYRVDPSRTPSKPGAGLGLAVARDIIRAHQGDIEMLNHPDGGLLVSVVGFRRKGK